MALQFGNEDTIRVDVDGGENWIDVRRNMTVGLARKANRAAYGDKAKTTVVKDGGDGSKTELDFSFGEYNRVLLEGMVVAWSYEYPEGHAKAGQPVPVNSQTIELLDLKTQNRILKIIDEHNKDEDEDDEQSKNL